MPDGIISIGTNSTRVLLADLDVEPPQGLIARSIGTRVGEGLRERGRLSDEAMHRTLGAVIAHERAIRGRAERTFAIATSALRRAENGAEFAREVEKIVGVPLHILSGEEEAVASYRGAVAGVAIAPDETVGVVDTGGGSTEYAVGAATVPEHVVSCEIGAVRLTEVCPELTGTMLRQAQHDTVEARRDTACHPELVEGRARQIARSLLSPISTLPHVDRLIFVGGSATTAAALIRGDSRPFVNAELDRDGIAATLRRLLGMTLDGRKTLAGMNPQRADILPAGLIVLDEVFALTGHTHAIVTSSDLLLGYLLIQAEAASL
jgi:exopolyphosphatase/guanosine-5'-triphosphate,3'-diphosphate pyrophosphatase